MEKSKISVIIPAYNESATIGGVVSKVKTLYPEFEVIVVNDGSTDDTGAIAEKSGAAVYNHSYNIGNGAAIKAGIRIAAGDILVFMDGDGQHNPKDIGRLLEKMETYDMAVGARTGDSETSFHRTVANRIYNWFASYMCKHKVEDLTSGFRAIKGDVVRRFIDLLPNTFSYPTTITMAVVRSGFCLTYVPIIAFRRTGKSKINLIGDGSRFFLIMIKIGTLFSPMRIFLPVSTIMFLVGICYGLLKIFVFGGRYGPTSAMLITVSVVIFMVGLVSEQVAQLRFDRRETYEDRE